MTAGITMAAITMMDTMTAGIMTTDITTADIMEEASRTASPHIGITSTGKTDNNLIPGITGVNKMDNQYRTPRLT